VLKGREISTQIPKEIRSTESVLLVLISSIINKLKSNSARLNIKQQWVPLYQGDFGNLGFQNHQIDNRILKQVSV